MKPGLAKSAGFTLLELLIAMAVFAIMATMAYGGLKAVIDTQRNTAQRAQQMQELQFALFQIGEDLLQAVPRSVRDEFGDPEMAFSGGNPGPLLTLTKTAPDFAPGGAANRLQRVSYRLESGALYRLVWHTLDRTQQSQPLRKRLLSTDRISVRFWGEDWSGSWPAAGSALPKAVEITIVLDGLGEIRRGYWLS